MIRGDLSNRLIHLTRAPDGVDLNAEQVFECMVCKGRLAALRAASGANLRWSASP
jgi:hypothetical protein